MILVGLLLLSSVVVANATIIDFEDQVSGSKANGYTIGGVSFSDSIGQDLNVLDYGNQSKGKALGVNGDDLSKLQLSFSGYYNFLSFEFGNDDPSWGNPPNGQMHLDLYKDGNQVNSFALTANWDDVMNQTLSGTGLFNYAEIYYDANLIEILDNITYRNDTAPVPEPGTMMLLGLGMAGLAIYGKRRAKKA
jgi:hypothetical protein